MGQIKTDFIQSIPVTFPKTFVETGTYLGGIPLMSLVDKSFEKWDKMYTIELSEKCCKIASTRYKLYEELGIEHNFEEKKRVTNRFKNIEKIVFKVVRVSVTHAGNCPLTD